MITYVGDVVLERLHRVFADLEDHRGVSIDKPVRAFVSNLVMESLEFRNGEWVERGLDPDKKSDAEGIASEIESAVRTVTGEADTYKSQTGSERVLLVGVVAQAHKEWCGVFPFCR